MPTLGSKEPDVGTFLYNTPVKNSEIQKDIREPSGQPTIWQEKIGSVTLEDDSKQQFLIS